jgi:glycosyltransferase A (GT-A) superfamily protein (DUF2064 family)
VSDAPPSSTTAVLFFSHRPEREWSNKQFVPRDRAKSRRVAGTLYRHTRSAVAESGFPWISVTDDRQRGTGFGERLTNALADAFAEGYERVIVVGSDCPRLHEVDWQHVDDRLAAGYPVLGPTPGRDGTYLIGLTREQFDAEAFAALPWQTPRLFGALAAHLADRAGAPLVLLQSRADVNGHADLLRLLRTGRAHLPQHLTYRLRRVLGAHVAAEFTSDRHRRPSLRRIRSRGPPRLVAA